MMGRVGMTVLKHCWREECEKNSRHPKYQCEEEDIFITAQGRCGAFARLSAPKVTKEEK